MYADAFCFALLDAISREVVGSIPDEVTGFLNWPNPSSSNYGPGVDSASNSNKYQESSWE
jgi:hypothetical protein